MANETEGRTAQEAGEVLPPARMRALALILLTGLALFLCYRLLQPFLPVLVWATALAVLFDPMRERLFARWGSRNAAAAVTLAAAVLLVLLPMVVVSLSLANEISNLFGDAPEKMTRLLADPDVRLRMSEIYAQARERFPILAEVDWREAASAGGPFAEALVQGSLGAVGKVLQAAIRFVLIAFTLFFFLRDGDRFAAALRDLLPLSRRQASRLFATAVEVLRASTYGVVVVAFIQGALGGAMFVVLGIPAPILWAAVMALFAMIPMVGTAAIWLPASILLLVSGKVAKAIVLALWGALVVSTIDNVLRPRLVGKRARMHELLVFFGVLGGLRFFGLAGLLVGPAVFAIAASLLKLARERNGAAGASEKKS
jgi:predicted PurR-regulated permease PerM